LILDGCNGSVSSTRIRYYEEYTSAEKVKANFGSDLSSAFGRSLATDMYLLGLTRFENVRDEFLSLCREHGV
jgi:hypothetical protein